jgi:cephalosporin hydroxylase
LHQLFFKHKARDDKRFGTVTSQFAHSAYHHTTGKMNTMNPIEQFQSEQRQRITSNGQDKAFQALSRDWLLGSMQRQYVYNFDWMGRPIIQYPQDMVAIQELVWSVRPDLIIETGIAHGGSLMLSASLLAMLDICDAIEAGTMLDPKVSNRKVIGVDIDIRPHNRAAIESHPLAGRIKMIQGSSIDPATVLQVQEQAKNYQRVLVLLDSMHTHDHVEAELEAYAPMVSLGSYCVVFDTFVEDMPRGFFSDRPWDVGNNPKTAVRQWLRGNNNFQIDESWPNKLMVTVAPDGFLKRVN